MKVRRLPGTRAATLAAACIGLAGCAGPEPAPTSWTAASTPAAPIRIAQQGSGPQAAFRTCQDAECPGRTPKTWATPQRAATPVSPIAFVAAPATTAGSHWMQIMVRFPVAGTRLDRAARDALRDALPLLRQALRIEVAGHTDNVGTAASNLHLARARAQTVLAELQTLASTATSSATLEVRGDCCPIAPNTSAQGRALNRRVEIQLLLADQKPP